MSYKYFGLLATIILICGLVFVLYRWPQDRHKTFSQHVALRRGSIVYYCLLFVIVLPLLVVFFVGWFTPYFGISIWFNIFVILAAIFQLSCTLVPEIGSKITTHRSLAGLAALLLSPPLLILLFENGIGFIAKIFVGLGLLTMALCIFLVIKAKGNPRNFLIIQSAYFAAFLLPVLFIGYFNQYISALVT